MVEMNCISVSGGKDSTALLLWAIENMDEIRPVFADTGNEHEITLEYVDYLEQVTGIKIARVRGKLLFPELCLKRRIFPGKMRRFCTTELKMRPVREYLKNLPELTTLVIGVRRDESRARTCVPDWGWSDFYRTDVWRPIADWTVEQVFEMHRRHGIKPNPLYTMGFTRVGCMPCINWRKGEIKRTAKLFPEHIQKLREWEGQMVLTTGGQRTFFEHGDIDSVLRWAGSGQGELFEAPACMSAYGLCE